MEHKYFNFFSVLFSHLKYATPNLDKSSVCCREGVEERRGRKEFAEFTPDLEFETDLWPILPGDHHNLQM